MTDRDGFIGGLISVLYCFESYPKQSCDSTCIKVGAMLLIQQVLIGGIRGRGLTIMGTITGLLKPYQGYISRFFLTLGQSGQHFKN